MRSPPRAQAARDQDQGPCQLAPSRGEVQRRHWCSRRPAPAPGAAMLVPPLAWVASSQDLGSPRRLVPACRPTSLAARRLPAPGQPGRPALPHPAPAPSAAGREHPLPLQSELPEHEPYRARPVGPVNRDGPRPSLRPLQAGKRRAPPFRLADVRRWRGRARPVRPRQSRLHPRAPGSRGQGPLMIHVERWERKPGPR